MPVFMLILRWRRIIAIFTAVESAYRLYKRYRRRTTRV